MLHVICFSHRRQLQLHGYLESLFHYSSPGEVTVVYPEQDYSTVSDAFPSVNFRQERRGFEATLWGEMFSSVWSEFVMFCCDDMVFTRSVSIPDIGNDLQDYRILGHSLRLHDKMQDASKDGLWEWTKYPPDSYWGYPFDLTGTIYRTETIKNLLANLGSLQSPNGFESDGCKFIREHLGGHYPLMSRDEFPSCIIQQVNNVQTTVPCPTAFSSDHAPEHLEEVYQAGYRLDWQNAAGAARDHVWTNDFWRIR